MSLPLQIPDLKKITECNRLQLGTWPTPLEQHGAYKNFFIKRDDLSGYGRGGIKTRKLETAFAYILQKKYTDVVLVVPNVSNLRSDIELFSRNNNTRFHLILANDPYIEKEKRNLPANTANVFYTIAGKSKFIAGCLLVKKYLSLLLKGKKAAWFFPSLAHPAAVMGAARGLVEMATQYMEQGIPFPKHIFVSGCTGTGAAGLILSSAILKQHKLADITIHTAKVFPLPLKMWMTFLLFWTKWKYNLMENHSDNLIHIHHKAGNAKYGESNAELEKICEEVNENFNIRIDPIYGARSWACMKEFISTAYENDGLVFWHCGYTPDWNMLNRNG